MALAGLLGLLASLPKILGYIESAVVAAQKRAEAEWEKAQAMKAANAIEYAKITKDTSKLEDLFNPRPKP